MTGMAFLSRIAVAAVVASGLLATGCSSLTRLPAVPAEMTSRAEIPGIPNCRYWLDIDLEHFLQDAAELRRREHAVLIANGGSADPQSPVNLLAISGGGDGGAFSSGILAGWTASGTRPKFLMVTGISAGALVAPFAFLGSEYDDVIRNVSTSIGLEDVIRERFALSGLFGDGMASIEPLARLVERYVTADMLAAIAREYANGRLLLIGTTDLDSGRQVTWNMGAIAASGAPGSLALFRKIMVASSSVPGVVSPVMFDVIVDGKAYQEMHVDGGVVTQVFLYPAMTLSGLQRITGVPLTHKIHGYVIRNGRIDPEWRSTERKTLDIGMRAISSLVQFQGINDLYRLAGTARQDKLDFNVTYIGADFHYPHSGEFDREYMKQLFAYGYRLGETGDAWHKRLPDEPEWSPDAARQSP